MFSETIFGNGGIFGVSFDIPHVVTPATRGPENLNKLAFLCCYRPPVVAAQAGVKNSARYRSTPVDHAAYNTCSSFSDLST